MPHPFAEGNGLSKKCKADGPSLPSLGQGRRRLPFWKFLSSVRPGACAANRLHRLHAGPSDGQIGLPKMGLSRGGEDAIGHRSNACGSHRLSRCWDHPARKKIHDEEAFRATWSPGTFQSSRAASLDRSAVQLR
ncbi:uncharacterized protein VTP21DRAFT_7325 [Calcarisporiella thermophila]|uniref:uncharacterized protein n=1 Tax=Calcarisporiella thermophila TaxID=911321 RepID=UPI0037449C63